MTHGGLWIHPWKYIIGFGNNVVWAHYGRGIGKAYLFTEVIIDDVKLLPSQFRFYNQPNDWLMADQSFMSFGVKLCEDDVDKMQQILCLAASGIN